MKCAECVNECKAEGGLCAPMDYQSFQVMKETGIRMSFVAKHRTRRHSRIMDGGFWRCAHGHDPVEANPADAMRAAGVKPML